MRRVTRKPPTTVIAVRAREYPSASAASRNDVGTSDTISSVVRVTQSAEPRGRRIAGVMRFIDNDKRRSVLAESTFAPAQRLE